MLKKIWHDPVWSKVLSAGIIVIIGVIFSKIAGLWPSISGFVQVAVLLAFSKSHVPNWLLAILGIIAAWKIVEVRCKFIHRFKRVPVELSWQPYTPNTIEKQYNKNDIVNLLADWIGKHSNQMGRAIHFSDVDGDTHLPNGTTKKYLKEAAMRWHYVVDNEGDHTISFKRRGTGA